MDSKKKLKVAGGIVLVIIIIVLIYFVLMLVDGRLDNSEAEDDYEYDEENSIVFGNQIYELTHDVSTYLIMGTDNSGSEEESRETYRGSMADFLLVVMVDNTDKTYGYIQLNRDTMTEVTLLSQEGTGTATSNIQLCCAHWYGGTKRESCKNTVKAVSKLLRGIPIDGYYALKMEAMPKLNHAVGGVTVTIEDDFTAADPEMKQGRTLKLTDEQAYLFVRARQGMADDDNTARMRRHRAFMDAFVNEIKLKSGSNQKFIADVYNELAEYSTTDMGSKTVSNLAMQIKDYTFIGMETPVGTATVGQALDDGIDHAEFYVDEDALDKLLMDMYPLQAVKEIEVEE